MPKVEGLKREDGWIDMQVQFLIDKKSAGADHVVGWTVLQARRQPRARTCTGTATSSSSCSRARATSSPEQGLEPSGEGDVVYSPRGCWHGFNNTSNEDVVLVWGWMGAGSIEASGYEVPEEKHRHPGRSGDTRHVGSAPNRSWEEGRRSRHEVTAIVSPLPDSPRIRGGGVR